jgi:hypothetical protein
MAYSHYVLDLTEQEPRQANYVGSDLWRSRIGGNLLSQVEIDFLLVYLRGELDYIDQSIVALERMARIQRSPAVQPAKHPLSSGRAPKGRAGMGWNRHRRRAG